MADGTEKGIEYIEVGDEVLQYTKDGEVSARVLDVMKPHYNDCYNVLCKNGHTMTTMTQPLQRADGEFISLLDLKIGETLKRVGEIIGIVHAGEWKVYDIQTDGENSYIADGFIARGGAREIWQS